MPFSIDLCSKVVLSTGASSGIGLGIARQGATVAGCGLESPEIDVLASNAGTNVFTGLDT